MSGVNRVILIGNLGHSPDLKFTPDKRPVCNLSIATNEVRKDKGGQRQEHVEWHRVQVWGELAENCSKYLSKGRAVYVEGRLTTRQWRGRDGAERTGTEIVAEKIVFLGGAGDGDRSQHSSPGPGVRPAAPAPRPPDEEDVPF